MESYILNDFEVEPKHSSEEVVQRWRKLCGFVKNPKRRFRFTANLSKRYEAQAMRRTNQVSHLSLILFIIYLFHSTNTKKKKKNPQCPISVFGLGIRLDRAQNWKLNVWIVLWDLFLMKKLWKSEICGSVNSARCTLITWKSFDKSNFAATVHAQCMNSSRTIHGSTTLFGTINYFN